MFYFAYGSNLSTNRIKARVPSAIKISKASLPGHQLKFHKIGRDNSGKCDAFFTGNNNDIVLGIVYSIDPEEKKLLNRAEGLGNGYEIKKALVYPDETSPLSVFTYYATHIDKKIQVLDWYKSHVLYGMKEHSFPHDYLEQVEEIKAIIDSNQKRKNQELSIYQPS